MMQFHWKKKLLSFIISVIFISICVSANESNNENVIYENQKLSSFMKIAIPAVIVGASLYIASNDEYRWYFKDRWIRFTSPNHAGKDQETYFHFTAWEDEKAQETQCDKGVHFIFSYLPVIPLATLLDKGYDILALGKIRYGLSDWSIVLSSMIVTSFGLFEEYTDGFQKGEGFDMFDLLADVTGVSLGVLKHYNYLEGIDFFWSYNTEAFENSFGGKKWPWWIYMSSFSFALNINIVTLLTKVDKENKIYNLVFQTPGYLPDIRRLGNPDYR